MAAVTDLASREQAPPTKRRRQNPISCRSCREKKLKCDRQNPCSNCAFRGLVCSNEPKLLPQSGPNLLNPSESSAVLQRLGRLESIVLNQEQSLAASGDPAQHVQANAVRQVADITFRNGTPIDTHAQHKQASDNRLYEHEAPTAEYAETVRSLEGTNLRRNPWLLSDAVNIQVKIASVQNPTLVASEPALNELRTHRGAISCILPRKEEAILLLDYYKDYLEDLQHFLHFPTVQNNLETCYAKLARGQPVDSSVLALLLAVFASASLLMSHNQGLQLDVLTGIDSTRLSTHWTVCALEILRELHSRSCETIEDIQSTLILGFVFLSTQGFSSRLLSFCTSVISRAHDLSLHKIDVGGPSASSNDISTEIKRRLWWSIVNIDWILAASGGPQEGTYSISPRHMAVNIPRNTDDKDLIYADPPMSRPLSEPTAMSYDLQRIKIANLCRELVDLLPISVHDILTIDYQQVIALDQRFDSFLQELPVFLRNDEQSIQQSTRVVARYPQMRLQRQFLSMLAKAKRCKLHQPFLIRGSIDTRYSYSRTMSLKSARALLEEQRRSEQLDMDDQQQTYPYKLTYRIYYTFIATVVLVMDLCFNKLSSGEPMSSQHLDTEDEETKVTKAEIMEACRSLYQDKVTPSLSTAYLESLMDVLRKYKVQLRPHNSDCVQDVSSRTKTADHPSATLVPWPSARDAQRPAQVAVASVASAPFIQQRVMAITGEIPNPASANSDSSAGLNMRLDSWTNDSTFGGAEITNPNGLVDQQAILSDFDDIWNAYVDLGPNLDTAAWDSLFSDLGSRMT